MFVLFITREPSTVELDAISGYPRFITKCSQVTENEIACNDDRFVGVFSGKKRETKRVIIDLIPFGYNVDFFDLRRCEHADLVPTTIVVEQDRLHRGQKKPFVFPDCHKPGIVCIRDHVPSIMARHVAAGNRLGFEMWPIEHRFRDKSVEIVNGITNRSADVWVMQNDGDELINRDALRHFAWCEVHPDVDMVYAPAILFKHTVQYTHNTTEMLNLPLGPSQHHLGELRRFLWHQGPSLVRGDVWTSTFKLRRDVTPYIPHLGLGAANHFSAPNHPGLKSVRLKATVDAKKNEKVTDIRGLSKPLYDFLKSHLPLELHAISYLTKMPDLFEIK